MTPKHNGYALTSRNFYPSVNNGWIKVELWTKMTFTGKFCALYALDILLLRVTFTIPSITEGLKCKSGELTEFLGVVKLAPKHAGYVLTRLTFGLPFIADG